MKVARASRLGDEELYGHPIENPWASNQRNRMSFYSVLLERGRRAWWGIVSMDNLFAAIHGTDPVIPWHEFTRIKMSVMDDVYEALAHTDDVETGSTNTAGYLITGKVIKADANSLPEGSVVLFVPLTNWSVGPNSDIAGSRPILSTSIVADGGFSPQTAVVRIAQINAQISAFRRLRITPWNKDLTRTYLLEHLASWLAESPPTFKSVTLILATVPRPIPAGVGMLVYLNLMYLSGMLSLVTPAEQYLWKGEADEGWIQSEAYVQARMLADQVTDLLAPLVDDATSVPQMALPVSVHCLRLEFGHV
jgi:hypothetical protein